MLAGVAVTAGSVAFKNPDKPVKLEKALLWEISGKGLTKPSYLYGTIHAICPQDFVMTETIKAKVKSAEQVSLEFDFDDPNMMRDMLANVIMQDGVTLKSLYSEADFKTVSDYFARQLGTDLNKANNWKPMILNTLLMAKMIDCQPESFEAAFTKMAQEEVIGVETIASQLAAFDKIPYKKQAEWLLQSIREKDKLKDTFIRMTRLYKEQDLEGFQLLFKETSKEMAEFEDILLVERNKRWISVIEQEAREKPTFFAVGAGHLGGKEGVIRLLRKQGYTVEPVL
jgi:uncharacterized protein YbaP (TraB family)